MVWAYNAQVKLENTDPRRIDALHTQAMKASATFAISTTICWRVLGILTPGLVVER